MKRQSLTIATRDVKRSVTAREQLLAGGGNLKVHCLRIEDVQGQVEWMYESSDIIRYLDERFVAPSAIAAALSASRKDHLTNRRTALRTN
jgi:glutathione S-transferase